MAFDPEHPFSELDKSDPNTIQTYFRVEKNHMSWYMGIPKSSRKNAIKLIAQYADSEPRDPVVAYIAVNYYDNYISNSRLQDLPQIWEKGLDIFTTSCFVCASRMRNSRFSLPDFVTKHNINMETGKIMRIETIINRWLDDQNGGVKRPVTAVCFLDYLIGLLTKLKDYEIRCLKSFTTRKLYALQYDVWLTQFTPSVRAAAALVSTVRTLFEDKVSHVISKFVHCGYINKKSFKDCVEKLYPGVTVDILEPNPDSALTEHEEAAIDALSQLRDMDERSMVPDDSHDSPIETEKLMLPTPEDTAKLEASIRKLNNTYKKIIRILLLGIPNSDISQQILPSLPQNPENSGHDLSLLGPTCNITTDAMPLKIPISIYDAIFLLVQSPDLSLLGPTEDTEKQNTDEETSKNSVSIITGRIPKSADENEAFELESRGSGSSTDNSITDTAKTILSLSPHDHSHVSDTKTTNLRPSPTDHNQQTANLSSDFLKLVRKLLR